VPGVAAAIVLAGGCFLDPSGLMLAVTGSHILLNLASVHSLDHAVASFT
jgi:hypothetical protein